MKFLALAFGVLAAVATAGSSSSSTSTPCSTRTTSFSSPISTSTTLVTTTSASPPQAKVYCPLLCIKYHCCREMGCYCGTGMLAEFKAYDQVRQERELEAANTDAFCKDKCKKSKCCVGGVCRCSNEMLGYLEEYESLMGQGAMDTLDFSSTTSAYDTATPTVSSPAPQGTCGMLCKNYKCCIGGICRCSNELLNALEEYDNLDLEAKISTRDADAETDTKGPICHMPCGPEGSGCCWIHGICDCPQGLFPAIDKAAAAAGVTLVW